MPLVEFEKFDLNQLKQMSRELAAEIEQRTEDERERAALEIKKIATSLGLTVEEIMAGKKGKRGKRPKIREHVPSSVQPVQHSAPEVENTQQKEEEKKKPEKGRPKERPSKKV